jgi:hypothetical protein
VTATNSSLTPTASRGIYVDTRGISVDTRGISMLSRAQQVSFSSSSS